METIGLFITGTNTEVGKTYVTALIAQSLVAQGRRVGVYKPVASGCVNQEGRLVSEEAVSEDLVSEDAVQLWEAAGRPLTLDQVCPQRFLRPLAPHRAAAAEGRVVDQDLLRHGLDPWREGFDIVLVEGVGGLMSPVAEETFVADLASEFGFPLVVVAANTLGVINQTLQTLITASVYAEGLEVAGVVLNDLDRVAAPSEEGDASRTTNLEDVSRWSVPPVLAHVEYGMQQLDAACDWLALAQSRA